MQSGDENGTLNLWTFEPVNAYDLYEHGEGMILYIEQRIDEAHANMSATKWKIWFAQLSDLIIFFPCKIKVLNGMKYCNNYWSNEDAFIIETCACCLVRMV